MSHVTFRHSPLTPVFVIDQQRSPDQLFMWPVLANEGEGGRERDRLVNGRTPSEICMARHSESGKTLWRQGEESLQTRSFRDAEPQPWIPPNAKKTRKCTQNSSDRATGVSCLSSESPFGYLGEVTKIWLAAACGFFLGFRHIWGYYIPHSQLQWGIDISLTTTTYNCVAMQCCLLLKKQSTWT